MIKFFRQIRQRLVSEGKTGKYFKYAVGEILLVVIGILIALQINNWNENRKVKANERDLYTRIISDLKTDENRINSHLNYYTEDLEFLNNIYSSTQGVPVRDSIIDFGSLRGARIFDLTIKRNYSNNLKEISIQEVNQSINQYFDLEQHVSDSFLYLWRFKEDYLKPYLAKTGTNDTKELYNNRHLGYFELREKNIFSYAKLQEQFGSVELDQMLFDLGVRTSWAKTALENLLSENNTLQNNLESELKNSFK